MSGMSSGIVFIGFFMEMILLRFNNDLITIIMEKSIIVIVFIFFFLSFSNHIVYIIGPYIICLMYIRLGSIIFNNK